MNVLFHTTSAICVAVTLTDTKEIEQSTTSKKVVLTGLLGFVVGVIFHGALDYIPHCYPINSKLDAISGLIMIISTIWLTNKRYRLIMGLSFLGSIFPDLVDLLPVIVEQYLELGLPKSEKVFPWHLEKYSGSIFTDDCSNSTLNHTLLLLTIGIICWSRKSDLKIIFRK